MLSRKTTLKLDCNKNDELITCLENKLYSPDCPEAETLAEEPALQFYFANLHQHITHHNFLAVKRYETLPDGLYVLLKGQVSFMFSGSLTEREKDLSKAKASLKSSTGTSMIWQVFSVFECCFKNCTAVEESCLLKIEEEQAVNAKFYELFNHRQDLYDNQYLACDHQHLFSTEDFSAVFAVDMKIHSNFTFKNYLFRQLVTTTTVGIVATGRVRIRGSSKRAHQIERYGVLLPGYAYEVTTAEVQIMFVRNNETLVMRVGAEAMQSASSQDKWMSGGRNRQKGYRRGISNCSQLQMMFTKKERAKRERQLAKMSKQSQNYSIISSFLCQKSLEMISQQQKANKKRQRREDRCRNPLILFNIVNEKSRLATPSFPNAIVTHTPKQSPQGCRSQKISSEFKKANSNHTLLRKLRLPLKQYQKMVKFRELEDSREDRLRSDVKTKSLFTLTAGKGHEQAREEEEKFVRYKGRI